MSLFFLGSFIMRAYIMCALLEVLKWKSKHLVRTATNSQIRHWNYHLPFHSSSLRLRQTISHLHLHLEHLTWIYQVPTSLDPRPFLSSPLREHGLPIQSFKQTKNPPRPRPFRQGEYISSRCSLREETGHWRNHKMS